MRVPSQDSRDGVQGNLHNRTGVLKSGKRSVLDPDVSERPAPLVPGAGLDLTWGLPEIDPLESGNDVPRLAKRQSELTGLNRPAGSGALDLAQGSVWIGFHVGERHGF